MVKDYLFNIMVVVVIYVLKELVDYVLMKDYKMMVVLFIDVVFV